MKVLKIQEIICMDKNGKFAIIKSHSQEELIEAIAELEGLNSCNGCKFNTQFPNYDMDTGKRLENVLMDACYMCSRNMNDRYEPKDNQ